MVLKLEILILIPELDNKVERPLSRYEIITWCQHFIDTPAQMGNTEFQALYKNTVKDRSSFGSKLLEMR